MSNICLIGCVKMKRKQRCTARDMYISPLFKARLKYALSLNKKCYIISAKYGLLALDDIIDPYDKTLNDMGKAERKAWAVGVIRKLDAKEGLGKGASVMVLAGDNYREWLARYYKVEYPFANISFGMQLKKLKEMTRQ